MSLNIVSTGGNFDKWIKWNSKAGRFYMKGELDDVEVMPTTFIADLEKIKTGWLLFAAGQAPSRVWDENLSSPAKQPTPEHRRGFSLRLFSKATFGGVAELSSSSMHLCGAVNDLYTAYEAQKSANPGKVAVVKFSGATTMKDTKGMNYKPNFSIEKFVDRPTELDAQPVAVNSQAEQVKKSVSEF